MKSARFPRAVLVAALLLSPIEAIAQSPVGQILGTVHDASGAVVAGAIVVVTNLATGQILDTKTDAAGDYLARELQPGIYSVTASSPGFTQVVRRPVTLVA